MELGALVRALLIQNADDSEMALAGVCGSHGSTDEEHEWADLNPKTEVCGFQEDLVIVSNLSWS